MEFTRDEIIKQKIEEVMREQKPFNYTRICTKTKEVFEGKCIYLGDCGSQNWKYYLTLNENSEDNSISFYVLHLRSSEIESVLEGYSEQIQEIRDAMFSEHLASEPLPTSDSENECKPDTYGSEHPYVFAKQ